MTFYGYFQPLQISYSPITLSDIKNPTTAARKEKDKNRPNEAIKAQLKQKFMDKKSIATRLIKKLQKRKKNKKNETKT
jgi:hypothetical protein